MADLGMRKRRVVIALGIYLAVTVAVLATMSRDRLLSYSPYNHYALQADAWLHGRLDLGGPPPAYTGNNDFALHEGKHYVSFGPVPAVIIMPVVALAGPVERVRDAQVFAWLAGIGPALLFLVFERLRRSGRSGRQPWHSVALALLFALGTVYWFTAVQGTVWFAGHVVGVALCCGYLLCSLEARHPALAGLLLALAFATRPSLGFAVPFFLFELFRAAQTEGNPDRPLGEIGGACWATLLRRGARFAVPAVAVLVVVMVHNHLRFGDPTEFGHRFLTVAWRKRIDTWGLFSFHYLGRNLSVLLTGLPFFSPDRGLQINGHGLALWLTSPFYVWALWPARVGARYWAAALAAICVALPNLLYQNSGWVQFGYRFSNDFAPFLFVMIVLSGRKLSPPFWLLGAVAMVVNGFGAVTFDRAEHRHFYFIDRTQRIVHQPD